MKSKKVLATSCLAAVMLAAPLSAEPVKFDYSKTSDQKTVEYDRGLEVVVENINSLDFTYDILVESLLPQPIAPPALPTPGSDGPSATPNNQDDFDECVDLINASLLQRLKTFGEQALADWKTSELDGLATKGCNDSGALAKIQSLLRPQFQATDPGRLTVTPAIGSALAATGPGGKLIITIEASPKLTKIAGTTAPGLTAQRVEGTDLDTELAKPANAAVKAKVDQHKVTRKFTVNFEPPEGILFSFGPYISQLERQEFERVANPNHDPMDENSNEFMIGLAEDSDQSYGVAAYWSVLVWQAENVGYGFSWGIAYDAQNEVDEAVQGLLSLAIEFRRAPLLVHVGAAVGRHTKLADGFNLMDAIGANQEIPTTKSTEVELYLGISFRFGRR